MTQFNTPYVQGTFNGVRGQYACVKNHIDGYSEYLKEDGKWGYIQDAKIFTDPNDAVEAIRKTNKSVSGGVRLRRKK